MKSIQEFLFSSQLAPETIHQLVKGVKQKKVAKGTILQARGDKGRMSFFVRKGLLRSYTIDEKGKEHVFMFAPEGWVAGEVESYSQDSPTVLFIDALEDSEIEIIDSKVFNEFDQFPAEVLREQINKLVKRISVLQHRVLMLMSANAAERYQEFIKTYPNITQRVPQRMIASYLGITPEALSKIRGQIAKK